VDGVKNRPYGKCRLLPHRSAQRGGRRLVSLVIGTVSERLRARESQKLLNFGFQSYDALRLYEEGRCDREARGVKGSGAELKGGGRRRTCT